MLRKEVGVVSLLYLLAYLLHDGMGCWCFAVMFLEVKVKTTNSHVLTRYFQNSVVLRANLHDYTFVNILFSNPRLHLTVTSSGLTSKTRISSTKHALLVQTHLYGIISRWLDFSLASAASLKDHRLSSSNTASTRHGVHRPRQTCHVTKARRTT